MKLNIPRVLILSVILLTVCNINAAPVGNCVNGGQELLNKTTSNPKQ